MPQIKLSASVGINGQNDADDVLNVQKALNQMADKIGLTAPLAEDGQIGDSASSSPTCEAIGLLQRHFLGYHRPDYRIDCGGKSEQALNHAEAPSPNPAAELFSPRIEPKEGSPNKIISMPPSTFNVISQPLKQSLKWNLQEVDSLHPAHPSCYLRPISFRN
ncbi:hypothetical protein P4S72_14130 [Vibrio sp. PP-XX7]